jgi:hypothetical protein
MCDFLMTGERMTREELLEYEVEKELYDLSRPTEFTKIMELIGFFVDGCDQVLVNNKTIFRLGISKDSFHLKLCSSTASVLQPYFDEAKEAMIVTVYMHPCRDPFVFQVVFEKKRMIAITRGFKQPFFIKQISITGTG